MPGRPVDGKWTEESDSSVGIVRKLADLRITDDNRNQGDVGGTRNNVLRELLTIHRGRNDHGPLGESNGQVVTISPIKEESEVADDDEDVAREEDSEESEGVRNSSLSRRIDRVESVHRHEPDNYMEVEIPAEIDPGFNEEGNVAEENEGNGDNEESEGNSADDASSCWISSTLTNSCVLSLVLLRRCTDHVKTSPSCVNYWMKKLQKWENSGKRKKISAAIKNGMELEIPVEIDPGFNEESGGNVGNEAGGNGQTRPSCVNYWTEKLQQCDNSGTKEKIKAAIKKASCCAKIQKKKAEIDILVAKIKRKSHPRPMIQE